MCERHDARGHRRVHAGPSEPTLVGAGCNAPTGPGCSGRPHCGEVVRRPSLGKVTPPHARCRCEEVLARSRIFRGPTPSPFDWNVHRATVGGSHGAPYRRRRSRGRCVVEPADFGLGEWDPASAGRTLTPGPAQSRGVIPVTWYSQWTVTHGELAMNSKRSASPLSSNTARLAGAIEPRAGNLLATRDSPFARCQSMMMTRNSTQRKMAL